MRVNKGWLLGLILVLTGSMLSGCLAGEENSASDQGLEEKVVVYSPTGRTSSANLKSNLRKSTRASMSSGWISAPKRFWTGFARKRLIPRRTSGGAPRL